MIGNIALLLLTSAGIVLLCEHLVDRWTRQADRRHWDRVKARLDESRWPKVRR